MTTVGNRGDKKKPPNNKNNEKAFLKNGINMQKEYWCFIYSMEQKKNWGSQPGKNSLNCIEYSLQGKEMNNLFYALKSSHAVLTQYDYSLCVMYFREISQ